MPFPLGCLSSLPRRSALLQNVPTLSSFGPLSPYSSRQSFSFSSSCVILSPGPGTISLGCPSLFLAAPALPRLGRRTLPARYSSYRQFSTSSTAMAATKIDGTAIAKSIREGLKDEIVKIQQSNPRFRPCLVIFQGVYPPPNVRVNEIMLT